MCVPVGHSKIWTHPAEAAPNIWNGPGGDAQILERPMRRRPLLLLVLLLLFLPLLPHSDYHYYYYYYYY